MLKTVKLKPLIEHVLVNFIPFIIMTILAMFFLWRSYVMLESKNMSVVRGQIENVMEDVEKELLSAMVTAEQISSDPLLKKSCLNRYGRDTIAGMKQIQLYNTQLPYHASAFISYWPERVILGTGTLSTDSFLNRGLDLDDQSKVDFITFFEVSDLKDSMVLNRKGGEHYLLFLDHYPQSFSVDEKWVGILLETRYIEEEFARYLQGMDGFFFLYWKGERFGSFHGTDNSLLELDEIYEKLETEEAINGYVTMQASSARMDFEIKAGISNDALRRELSEEMLKMALIGILCFIVMSAFLWFYTHYRYVMMSGIRQFISANHPELQEHSDQSDYVLIQKVLKQDFEAISRRDEDLRRFEREAQKQLLWLLLNGSLPYDCSVEEIISRYGMEWEEPYCCVMDFLLESKEMPEWEDEAVKGVDVLLSYETRIEKGVLLILCINLHDRDEDYIERTRIIQLIRKRLLEQGFPCMKAACGMVYDSLSEICSSQQEAYTLIQDSNSRNPRDEILFFSRQTNMTGRVPGITSELMKQFRDFLEDKNRQEAIRVFQALMALPEDMAEDLLAYIRYKIVYTLIEVAQDMEMDQDFVFPIVELGNLTGKAFREGVYKVLERLIPNEKEKVEIEHITAFIEERYSDANMSIDMISSYFNINERSVRRIMKKSINKSYKEYLNDVRIRHACEMLVQTDWTIRMIASRTGFFHENAFYRVFRQVMGMSPNEYRVSSEN